MEQEATVPSEIPEVLIVLVGLVSHFFRLFKGNGLGGFVRNADVIEVDRMVKLVFRGDDHDGITRDLLINSEVNTQEESDDDQAEGNDSTYFPFLMHGISFRSGIFPAPRRRGFFV